MDCLNLDLNGRPKIKSNIQIWDCLGAINDKTERSLSEIADLIENTYLKGDKE